jgi:hypothetical protein
MIQKILIVALCLMSINICYSQTKTVVTNADLNPTPIFFGGVLVLGGGTGSFQIGLNPELVKSYNEYIDLGAAVNLYYASYRSSNMDNSTMSYKSNNTQFGLGGFVRAWPIKQFFIQVQPEYNWTFSNAKNFSQGTSGSSKVSAPSFLAGLGYGNRSENGFSYFSIMFDLINSQQSPYRMGQLTAQPIFRAGFGFPIRLSKSKRS